MQMLNQCHAMMHRFHNPSAGILLIRVALAAAFIFHGWAKVANMEGTIGFFASIGIGTFFTYVAAYTELLGGIALLLGVFVRYAGVLLAITMAVAICVVHWKSGFNIMQGGYEYAFTLMMASLAMVAMGAGKYSVAHHLKKKGSDGTCRDNMNCGEKCCC